MKAKHKHEYERILYVQENTRCATLHLRCTICGRTKEAPFSTHTIKNTRGFYTLLTKVEDFEAIYGQLPIVTFPEGVLF